MIDMNILKNLTQKDIETIGLSVLLKHIIITAEAAQISKDQLIEMFESVWSVKDKGSIDDCKCASCIIKRTIN